MCQFVLIILIWHLCHIHSMMGPILNIVFLLCVQVSHGDKLWLGKSRKIWINKLMQFPCRYSDQAKAGDEDYIEDTLGTINKVSRSR